MTHVAAPGSRGPSPDASRYRYEVGSTAVLVSVLVAAIAAEIAFIGIVNWKRRTSDPFGLAVTRRE
jgi:hypothetical protein